MFVISGNDLYLTRGEGVVTQVTVYGGDGAERPLDVLEKLRLTVFAPFSRRAVFSVDSYFGQNVFYLPPAATKALGAGQYDYEIKVIYPFDNAPYTILGDSPSFTPHFNILEG